MKTYGGENVDTHDFLTSELVGGEWSPSLTNNLRCFPFEGFYYVHISRAHHIHVSLMMEDIFHMSGNANRQN
jgi:hypothetical protein